MAMKIRMKAQSAMEYLMTYGWAILIISVVLASLFSLGVFNAGAALTTACVALAGYTCSGPLLHAGVLYLTVGQATGISWTNTIYYFDPTGTSGCNPTWSNSILTNSVWDSITVGSATSNTLAFIGTTTPSILPSTMSAGSSYSGTIWVNYNSVSGSSTLTGLCTQVATVTLKAV